MNESSIAKQSDALRTKISIDYSMLGIFLLFVLAEPANANDGDPVAIRYWPGGCSSIESMWNIHVAIGVDAGNRAALPRIADVEFVDDFWAASGSDILVLDRKPNDPNAMLKPTSESPNPSRNAIRFSRVALKNEATQKTLFVNVLFVDGVAILDSNKNSVGDLLAILNEVKDLPKEMQSIDAFLIDDAIADPASFETLRGLLKPRAMVLRSAVKFDKVGDALVEVIGHNTLSVSRSEPTSTSKWVKLSENPWSMDAALGDLFDKKEAACKSSRAVFKELSVNQLNFRPSIVSSSDAQEKQKGGGRSQAAPGKEPPHPPKVGDSTPDIELKNEKGDLVSLKELTREHAVVLLVLRGWPGYQCPICSRQVSEFMAKKTELEKAGAQVLMVYPGPAEKLGQHAKEFATQGKWEFPSNFHYVTDPDYKFTNDWGLRWEAERETAYPSTIIIGKDRKVAYLMTSTSHGGRAGIAAVLDELTKLK